MTWILASRRTWRSSPENFAAVKARTTSAASEGPMTRAPSEITFMSSSSTPWWAENVS